MLLWIVVLFVWMNNVKYFVLRSCIVRVARVSGFVAKALSSAAGHGPRDDNLGWKLEMLSERSVVEQH
jgi:hypothetical protein